MSKLTHPNIVSCIESFTDDSSLYIVMEYAAAGDLQKLINRFHAEGRYISLVRIQFSFFAEYAIRSILLDCLNALGCVHGHGVVHRDIKPSNILLFCDGTAKLCDFGIAQPDLETSPTQCKGTLQYMAPEIINKGNYEKSADIWSLGCVLYEIMWREPLFSEGSYSEVIAKIVDFKSKNWIEFPSIYSAELQEIVRSMLSIDPQARPSVQELMESDYLKKQDERGRSIVQYYAEQQVFVHEVKAAVHHLRSEASNEAVEAQAETGAEAQAETGAESEAQTQEPDYSKLYNRLLFDSAYIQSTMDAFESSNVLTENNASNVSGYK